MKTKYEKKTVEEWLNTVDYTFAGYMPTAEALLFVNFIKEVNGGAEENETPLVHLVMMDNVFNLNKRCAILCHRGVGKTTLFGEYLVLFIAAFGYLPGFGKTNLILYVTDSIENGVKNLRRNVEFRYNESEFLQKMIPNQRISMGTDGSGFVNTAKYDEQSGNGRKFTDIRLEFKNNKGHNLVVKGYGAKALSLDTLTLMADGTQKLITEVQIGDCVVNPGNSASKDSPNYVTVIGKSEIFNRPMYKISLEDGRYVKVCEDHLNSVILRLNQNSKVSYAKAVLTTKNLLKLQRIKNREWKDKCTNTSHGNLFFIENTNVVHFPDQVYTTDPYTLGLLLGVGLAGKTNKSLTLTNHTGNRFTPKNYLIGSAAQRVQLLRGLMDSSGSIWKNRKIYFCSNSEKLVDDVSFLVRSLGGTAKKRKLKKTYKIEIWISINPFRLAEKACRFTSAGFKPLVAITSIERIPDEPSQCIAVSGDLQEFIVNDFIRTHNTGVRGAKELGQRPTVAILDDLISDTDAESQTIIKTIENTVYKAVSKALSPTKQKMIWLGTPFNARDPLYKAVESGAWGVSVFPICEHFPVDKNNFKGSWEDRFTYEYVLDEYNEAQALGLPANFNQELMLRIMSDEDRLVFDNEIGWYSYESLLKRKGAFNFYITTDFATSDKEASDYSVIAVWALNHLGQWFWVDGVCAKQNMGKNMDELFRLAQKWKPQAVGIEVSGQQGGFIPWIQSQMMDKNIFFTLASDSNHGQPGIRPNTNKMVRFNVMVPHFKAHNIFFPTEKRQTSIIQEYENELALASPAGFKSKHDDCIDTISMLGCLVVWRPSEEVPIVTKKDSNIWEIEDDEQNTGRIQSYIV